MRVLLILFFLLCSGTLFLNTSFFVNAQVTPKWFSCIFGLTLLLLFFIIYAIFPGLSKIRWKKLFASCCFIIAMLCTIQALYGIVQYIKWFPAFEGHKVTGSFDNPAGFAASLCAGFFSLYYFVSYGKKWIRYATITAGIIIIIAIILSASRAGIISLIVVCSVIFFYKIKIATGWKLMGITTLLFVSLLSLYFLKKDSADGRLLIWRCSWEMIKDKPLFGHGFGGFKANYMNYQAKFFEEYPDSKYAMLADNVSRPFNEYIGLAVNYGLAGLVLLFAAGWFILKSFLRCKNNIQARIAVCCLLSITVFAFFSYPLWYPFVWIMVVLSIALIIYHAKYPVKIPVTIIYPALILMIPAIIFAGLAVYQRMMAEIKWKYIANKSLLGKTEQMLPGYEYLYKSMSDNELFLYNYASELNIVKSYGESLRIAEECEQLWTDYDLQMLMADNCFQLQQYCEAERHYQKAAAMCPVRFMPLYKLFQLYEIRNETEKIEEMRRVILDKPVKVVSPAIISIKNEVKQKIKLNDEKNRVPVNTDIDNKQCMGARE